MPGPRRRGRASLSVPPGPCRRAAESRRPPPCPRPAADLKVRGTITSPVPPRNRSTSHQDDRPRTSRHDRQTLPDPPRTGTSTYPPNMNLPLSHPSELHPQKNGRKARPRRNARAARPAPPNTAHPARRAGQALQRHGGPCRPDASRAPYVRPIRTPHVEIDIPVRDRRRHRQPHPTMSISTGRAPAHRCVPLALSPRTKPGCTWEKGALMKQGLLFFDIPVLTLVHQGQLTASHVRRPPLRTWERLLFGGRYVNSA